MAADLFWGDVRCFTKRRHRLGDLAALGMCTGHIDQHPGAPFGRQPGGVHSGGNAQGAASVAEFAAMAISYRPTLAGPNSVL